MLLNLFGKRFQFFFLMQTLYFLLCLPHFQDGRFCHVKVYLCSLFYSLILILFIILCTFLLVLKGNRKKVTLMLCQAQDTLVMEEYLAGI